MDCRRSAMSFALARSAALAASAGSIINLSSVSSCKRRRPQKKKSKTPSGRQEPRKRPCSNRLPSPTFCVMTPLTFQQSLSKRRSGNPEARRKFPLWRKLRARREESIAEQLLEPQNQQMSMILPSAQKISIVAERRFRPFILEYSSIGCSMSTAQQSLASFVGTTFVAENT